jgi:T5SS/PEP-CTERM-associated repeat protein
MGVWIRGLLIVVNVFAAVSMVHAATIYTWNDPSGGAFQSADNWSPNGVPVAGDTAVFDRAGDYTVTFTADAAGEALAVGSDTVRMDLGARSYAVGSEVQLGIASGDAASLTVSGGNLSSVGGRIGHADGARGSLTIDGSTWTNTNSGGLSFVQVGHHGSGSLDIVNGGAVSADAGSIAASVGETGDVVVSGSGSRWDNGGITGETLDVGLWGTGTLRVEQGGAVTSGSGTRVGSQGDGTVMVTGAGSTITKDVEPGALAVERSTQKQVPGYAARRARRRRHEDGE